MQSFVYALPTLFLCACSGNLILVSSDASTDTTTTTVGPSVDSATTETPSPVGLSTGQVCTASSECASGVCLVANGGGTQTCQAPSCSDGVKNGAETDIDCGGSCDAQGLTCANGKACLVNADCVAGNNCEALTTATKICVGSTCTDGIKDGDETDVDCGGGTCPPCAPGKACTDVEAPPIASRDCVSGVCAQNICQAFSCVDGVKNGTETDIDCGGAMCDTYGETCSDLKACLVDADCTSHICVTSGDTMVCSAPSLN